MFQQQNVPLSTLTTMRIGGPAQSVVTVTSREELREVVAACNSQHRPFFVIGGGSNIIARDGPYPGVIILNRIKGFELVREDSDSATVKVAAGEVWDDAVARAVGMNLSGIEALSAIPGRVGAAPVQNIGAYGQEIADTLIELDALETNTLQWVRLSRRDCDFAYRHSRFKATQGRNHIITSITLKLARQWMRPPFYALLKHYFERHQITDYSPAQVRRAVIDIRGVRLPDPAKVANSGSFFKNPIVDREQAQALAAVHPEMPTFPAADGRIKLAAGWLMEHAGLKGYANHGFATSPDNALVVINPSNGTFSGLERFREELVARVLTVFGVRLEQEPETL